jgi:site-specific DNA recombinase
VSIELVAIYARVSSEQQAEEHTIASQVAALRARVAEDALQLPAEREFLDEGYSGATLARPALERLRDLVAAGGIDRLYVHSPDRLARRYAYQALLLDEFQAAGVEVVFLNRALGQWGRVCELNVGGHSSRGAREAIGIRRLRTGCTFRCRR